MQKSAVLLRKSKKYGAEGVNLTNTPFLAVLQGIFDFLRRFAGFLLRTIRTVRPFRTWLYLSCSLLCSKL